MGGANPYRWIILIGLITAAILEVLDTTIINVALPQMAGNLGASNQEIAWVATGYILSNVVFLPMTGFFAQRFGRQRYLLASIVIFVVASFLCGISTSLGEMILWRILQGAGGAALISTSQATLSQIFPPKEQNIVQALFLLGIIVAPTLGPTLGGWLTDNATWNWCFFINIPVGIASFLIVSGFLKDEPGAARASLRADVPGIALLAIGLGSLQYVLEEGQQDDWFNSPWIVRLTILAVVSLGALLWWLLTPLNKQPVVDLRVLRNRELALSCLLFLSLGLGLYAGLYVYPLLAQNLLGFTPTTTGETLIPGGVGTAAVVVVIGALGPRLDPRATILAGVGLFVYAMWDLGHLSLGVGEAEVRGGLLWRGIALGCLFTPINAAAFGTIKPQDAQQAASMVGLARQLGGSFGTAIISTYLVNQTQYHRVELIRNVRSGNVAYESQIQGIAQNLFSYGYSQADARQAALGQVAANLQRQATMQAYNNCWLLIMVAFIVTAPIVFFLRKPKPGAAPGAA